MVKGFGSTEKVEFEILVWVMLEMISSEGFYVPSSTCKSADGR